MMDNPVIGFGKYKGQGKTIRMILDAGDHQYVAWMTENLKESSFDESVWAALAALGHGKAEAAAPSSSSQYADLAADLLKGDAPSTQYAPTILQDLNQLAQELLAGLVQHPTLGTMIVARIQDPEAVKRLRHMLQEMATQLAAGQDFVMSTMPAVAPEEDTPAPVATSTVPDSLKGIFQK